jgi:hypothetical protein
MEDEDGEVEAALPAPRPASPWIVAAILLEAASAVAANLSTMCLAHVLHRETQAEVHAQMVRELETLTQED